MRIAVISDIHANKVALEAVAADMPEVDLIVSAGDIVGYGPWPVECLEWIQNQGVLTLKGNHDRAVATGSYPGFNKQAAAGVEYAREELSNTQLAWLDGLPVERQLFDGQLKIVHGHPNDPDRYTYPEEYKPELLGDADVLILGHTHVQHHVKYDEGIILNPGSVGQPRDGDPGAAYTLIDLDAMALKHRRVEYDVGAVISAVRDAGLPRRVGMRLGSGR